LGRVRGQAHPPLAGQTMERQPVVAESLSRMIKKEILARATKPVKDRSLVEPAELPSTMQWVLPNLIWNWGVPSVGRTSRAQFEFCDHMPQFCQPDAEFVSSSDSFSQNYIAFLQLLSPDFQPQTLLEQAKQAATFPTGNPADGNVPAGWTTVVDGGGTLRWQPDWVVGSSPGDFLAAVKADDIKSSTIEVTDPTLLVGAGREKLTVLSVGTGSDNLKPIAFQPGDLQGIQLAAAGWGRVTIYPGTWFSSAIFALGRKAKFVPGYDASDVYGSKGLLRCRVADMIIAYKPSATLILSDSFAAQHRDAITNASSLRVVGIDLPKLNRHRYSFSAPPTKTNDVVNLAVQSTAEQPMIIGVVIQTDC